MVFKAPNLNEKEVQYFYNLLFILERVAEFKGFNISRIPPEIKKSIKLNPNFVENSKIPKPSERNTINYWGKSNHSKYLLKHIRNSFAHGLLKSKGDTFYFLDVPPGKEGETNLEDVASMIGSMDKDLFYKMMEAVLNTNLEIKKIL